MAPKLKIVICIFSIFLAYVFSCSAQKNFIHLDKFENLTDVHDRWLKKTGIPEVARLLQLPPYSHYANTFSQDKSVLVESENKVLSFNKTVKDLEGKCSDDVVHILENINSYWAVQMFDSDGKLPSGILRGDTLWTGDYKECNNVYAPLDEDGHGNFHGQYCVSSWNLHLEGKYSNVLLTVGLCVPDSCSGENLKTAMKNSSYILDRIPILKKLDHYVTLKDIHCKGKATKIDASGIIYLAVVSFFLVLLILGSFITFYDKWKSEKNMFHVLHPQSYGTLPIATNSTPSEIDNPKSQVNADIENESSYLNKPVSFSAPMSENRNIISSTRPGSVVKRILLCFSVIANSERILSTKNIDGQLLTIHGIRFLSLTWVILGHTYISAVSVIGNKFDVLKDIDTFTYQMLLQSPFSVDSFFLLSGFLLSYLFFKEMVKKDGKISWLYFYIHRLWRLTPAYLFAVFFYMLIFKYLGSGPFWKDDQCDSTRHSWWKYLLYINNFIPIREMCVGWSWYLANDMQFYLISPIFLYPLWKWPKAGFGIVGAFLLATWTTTGIMSYQYELIPMFVGATTTQNLEVYANKMWDSFDLIYDKPYTRIAPYLIGILLGYILHQIAGRKNFLSWRQQLLGWIVAAFCSLSVVFGLYHVTMDRTLSLFYNALCRSSYSIGVAWLIFVCETGHGGILTKFLSWKLFIPVSRLTYCTYLIHPMLIHGYYQSSQTAVYFTNLFAVTNFLGFLLMSYVVGFLYSLAFESPFMNLEKLVVKRK